ncbi:MAG: hypothetical protein SOZ27_07190 [Spirochaetia bacterium]|nr:hypothetical protein [Spirochaetia bacterium]
MDDRSLLNELAHEVKQAEREELLKKLQSKVKQDASADMSGESFKKPDSFEDRDGRSQERAQFLEQKYEKLSFVQKILVLCKQIFKRVDFLQAVE